MGLLNKTSGGTTLSHYNSFTFDGIFETTGLTASIPAATSQGGATTWSYTNLNQLQQESSARSGGYTQNFAFDSSGNPTTFKGTTQSFNSDNQQTGTGFAYDGNGSPTTYKGTTLTFDPENRMTGLGSSWSASYRADGLRASKTVSGTTTYYLYDGGEPVCELGPTGALVAYNVFAPDGLVARRKAAFPTWTEYTFDQQGNVAQRLDASQSIITSSYYDAYGVENTTGTPTDQFGYNGRSGYFLDRETGLYLCQHRYFDPAGGRWVTRDPIGYAGGINVYGYCGSGPVGGVDGAGFDGETSAAYPLALEDAEVGGDLTLPQQEAFANAEGTTILGDADAAGSGWSTADLASRLGWQAFEQFAKLPSPVQNAILMIIGFVEQVGNEAAYGPAGGIPGTRCHTAVEGLVNGARFGEGITVSTEVTYKAGSVVKYGTKGGARLDAGVHYNGSLAAVLDYKFWGAKLPKSRINSIYGTLPGDFDGPVMPIHFPGAHR